MFPNITLGSRGTANAPAPRSFGPREWLFAVALVAAAFLVYYPAWHGGFLFDDDGLLLNNPVLRPGGLARARVPGSYLNYWPLTYTLYRLEFEAWRLNPLGFHLVNIALHAISALLVWRVLVRLKVPGAMFAAAIFALHPVNVESVAWISSLKNVLSLMLALVSVLFFLAYERQGGWWRSALALAAFGLSGLAKGMFITLPVVLLAMAWWQRGRIDRRDLLRVLPYFLMAAVMGATEVWTARRLVAEAVVRSDGLLSRAAVAGCAVWFYLWKLIWPLDLCVIYPRWRIDDPKLLFYPPFYLPGGLLAMVLAVAWWRRRTWGRPIVMLIVCYVALLLPALGFVNMYFMIYSLVADHWQYAAMIVPCAVFAAAAARLALTLALSRRERGPAATLAPRRRFLVRTGYVLGAALLAVLACLTWRQSGMYADAETLYRTTIRRNPKCWVARNNLGKVLAGRGEPVEAIRYYREALEIRPDYELAHNNLGVALVRRGDVAEAIVHFQKALEIKPDFVEAHNNLGAALAGRGELAEAIAQFRKALEIQPNNVQALDNLGSTLARQGKVEEAIAEDRKALEIKPDDVEAHDNLGMALAGRGEFAEAIGHFKKALEIKPDDAEAHANLGLALAGRGQVDEAIAEYRKALEIKPDHIKAHYNLGRALAGRGQAEEAIAQLRKALEIKPNDVDAHNDLGLVLGDRGRAWLNEAISHFQSALELNPNDAPAHNNLALALARLGQFKEAIDHYHKALKLQPDYWEAHNNLANLLAARGQPGEALVHFQKALKIRPDDANILHNMAWLRATYPDPRFRDGAQAVTLARRAVELSPSDANSLGILAAAYAEAGQFAAAVRTAHQAVDLARQQKQPATADSVQAKIRKFYEAGRPYHEPPRGPGR